MDIPPEKKFIIPRGCVLSDQKGTWALELYTVAQVAEIMHVNRGSVYKHINKTKGNRLHSTPLEPIWIGGRALIPRSQILKWQRNRQMRQSMKISRSYPNLDDL